jgi:uncharacterized membrane protein YczE
MAFLYRLLFFIIGLFIMTFGVCLTIKADLGAGAWDALNVALTNRVGLTIGTWVMIAGGVLIIVNAILLKRWPELLSVITFVVIGSMIDFWMNHVFDIWQGGQFIVKLGALILGLAIIGFGASIYLQAKFPLNPIDNFMMAIKKRLSVNLMVAKTIGEIVALIPAILLKGPIGIGTIIITFAVGPFIQIFFPYFEKIMQKLQA